MTQPTLAERAAAKAGRADVGLAQRTDVEAPVCDVIPDLGEYEPGEGDPEMVPVHIAWLRARRDVRAIGKREQYNGGGTRFNFRGVDTTVNTFGPVTLSRGLNLLPINVEATYRDATSANNKKMHECTVLVTWQLMGPMGDSLPPVQSAGEALDSADKATAKAQSVALRVILLTLGLTPTSDPDPDSSYVERGEAPARPAASYLDEISNPATSVGRLRQIHAELQQTRQANALVTNEVGDEEPIGAMVIRIGRERAGGGQ
ncbi:hypothetical protein ACFXDE_01615 [Kitasatospora sp. NPDC059408]|uniref:hypothetical protein n=1 Tax=Kitasatospora sp. NPDC059408 TaxID=3346823 RepID=UPI0036BAADB7